MPKEAKQIDLPFDDGLPFHGLSGEPTVPLSDAAALVVPASRYVPSHVELEQQLSRKVVSGLKKECCLFAWTIAEYEHRLQMAIQEHKDDES